MANRQYSDIWNTLKKDNHCTIAVHVALHRRVIKAVIKEKDMDIGFKITGSDAVNNGGVPTVVKLRYIREGARIRFFLTRNPDYKQIKGKDL